MANDPVPMTVSVRGERKLWVSTRIRRRGAGGMRREYGDSLAKLAMHDVSDAAPSRPSGLTGAGPSESSCKSGRRSST